jgi:hypothetical protein
VISRLSLSRAEVIAVTVSPMPAPISSNWAAKCEYGVPSFYREETQAAADQAFPDVEATLVCQGGIDIYKSIFVQICRSKFCRMIVISCDSCYGTESVRTVFDQDEGHGNPVLRESWRFGDLTSLVHLLRTKRNCMMMKNSHSHNDE